MEPFKSDGNSLDPGVKARLHRLDRQLRAHFSVYALDLVSGRPIEARGNLDPETGIRHHGPVVDPAWYLWRKDNLSSHHFFVSQYPRFTHREVQGLEGDIARFTSVNHLARVLIEREEERNQRRLQAARGFRQDKVEANERRIRDLISGRDTGHRDARAFSYGGQTSRTSTAEQGRVLKDRHADGWE